MQQTTPLGRKPEGNALFVETTISKDNEVTGMQPTKFVPIDQIDWNSTDPHPYDLIDWDNEDALPKRIGDDGREYLDIPVVPMTEEEFEKIDWARMMMLSSSAQEWNEPENDVWNDFEP